jgi:hypothetical protein
MKNPITGDSYDELKEKAKEFYRKVDRVWSPALDSFVLFNRAGFQHLIRPKSIQRPKGEQKRRFLLLPLAPDIIKNPDATVKYQQKEVLHRMKVQGEKIEVVSVADFWEFKGESDQGIVKVIVRQFSGQEKHFLSVYERKRGKSGKEKPSSH